MINITIVKIKQKIVTIETTGHSGYAEAGSDVVCSAVSTLMQSLQTGLEMVLKINAIINIDEEIPHMSISLPKDLSEDDMKNAQMLMRTTELSLKGVQNGYEKYIKIKEKQHD